MPAFKHGKNSNIQLDNAAGVLTDISTVADSVTLPKSIAMGDTTAFGSTDKTFIVGLRDNKISVKGLYDPTVDAQIDALETALMNGTLATATVQYGPAGTTTGLPKYTAECLVSAYEVSGGVGDVVKFSLELQITGAVTRTTF